jgi:hypothetical protein
MFYDIDKPTSRLRFAPLDEYHSFESENLETEHFEAVV